MRSLKDTGKWVPIEPEDYDEEQLEDGTNLSAIMHVVNLLTGQNEYYGIIHKEDEED